MSEYIERIGGGSVGGTKSDDLIRKEKGDGSASRYSGQ